MIRVYIKDEAIVKIVNEWYFDIESPVELAEVFDVDFSITDNIEYKDWEIIKKEETE